ncbi:MAG: hypothetical protein ACLPTZ_07285 [Beijerinckiaceae bacterium]
MTERTSAAPKVEHAQLSRSAAFLRWFAAAGVSDLNTFTPTAVLYAAWQAASERPGSVGTFCGMMRAAGVVAYRTNRKRALRYRLIDINEIAGAILAATAARATARTARDAEALASAVRAQLQVKRQAGALLDAGVVVPSLYIGHAEAEYCQALAQMTDELFERCVRIAIGQAVRGMKRSRPREPASPIRTIVSEWFLDADGVLTRTVSGEGERPILKGEGFQDEFQVESRSESAAPAQRSNGGFGREV